MRHLTTHSVLAAAIAAGVGGCGDMATLPERADEGPQPTLVEPTRSLIPTLHIAPARGWTDGGMPNPAAGLAVNAFASGLDHPRWLYTLPNGDVLVAETNKQPKKDDEFSLRKWVQGIVMKRAGASVPSADRITLLRDADGDGIAETRTAFLTGLHSPFGMALVGNTLYVANTDAVISFPYDTGDTQIKADATRVADLPAGDINHHWTKNIIASEDGSKLYATVGSNSNVAENGMVAEENRAAILEIDLKQHTTRCSLSACAIPTAWPGNRRANNCGRSSTNAMNSAAIWYRIT